MSPTFSAFSVDKTNYLANFASNPPFSVDYPHKSVKSVDNPDFLPFQMLSYPHQGALKCPPHPAQSNPLTEQPPKMAAQPPNQHHISEPFPRASICPQPQARHAAQNSQTWQQSSNPQPVTANNNVHYEKD